MKCRIIRHLKEGRRGENPYEYRLFPYVKAVTCYREFLKITIPISNRLKKTHPGKAQIFFFWTDFATTLLFLG